MQSKWCLLESRRDPEPPFELLPADEELRPELQEDMRDNKSIDKLSHTKKASLSWFLLLLLLQVDVDDRVPSAPSAPCLSKCALPLFASCQLLQPRRQP